MDSQIKEKIKLIKGDITKQEVDAIVNAANPRLSGGGGVDGAIHRAGGEEILKECKEIIKKIKRLDTGKAVATTAGKLKAKYVIHTVGPIWQGGNKQEAKLLESAYTESLKLAEDLGLSTVAFPSISTGAYGYPKEEAAKVAIKAVIEYLSKKAKKLKEVRFVLFDESTYSIYKACLESA
jgi:O-acetyl-ADP-ribose deacetylase (regulator of RNase III)